MDKEVVEKIRKRLRVMSADFDDDEIAPLAEACLLDMQKRGIATPDIENRLIFEAVVLYEKARFGFSEDSDRFFSSYEALADSIALADPAFSAAPKEDMENEV